MSMTTSRGEFLTAGMRGGLALVAGGSLLAVTAGTAAAKDTGDVAIAKLAATAELLAIDFYGRAIQRGGFTGDVLAYMEAARQNERDHYAALAAVIGSGAPKGVRFRYAAGTFASAASIADDRRRRRDRVRGGLPRRREGLPGQRPEGAPPARSGPTRPSTSRC